MTGVYFLEILAVVWLLGVHIDEADGVVVIADLSLTLASKIA